MKLASGVNLHVLRETKFKTIRLQVRFRNKFAKDDVAARVLLSNLMEEANQEFPTNQALSEHLAGLYGAGFSSDVAKKGAEHLIVLGMSLVNPELVGMNTLSEAVNFLHTVVFRPLWSPEIFEIEKTNLTHYLESLSDDNNYVATKRLLTLFYGDFTPAEGLPELVEKVSLSDVEQTYEKMIASDLVDIFVLGNVDETEVASLFETWSWSDRENDVEIFRKHQKAPLSVLTETKKAYQSVLQLAWHLPVVYGDRDYVALQVMNGVFGALPHSLLFKIAREQESLAYSIGSSFDSWSALFRVSAGVDAENAATAKQLILELLQRVIDGEFDDAAISDTKKMLTTSVLMSKDNPSALMEQAFARVLAPERYLDEANFLAQLDAVTKADIQAVARKLTLQVVYELEGRPDEN